MIRLNALALLAASSVAHDAPVAPTAAVAVAKTPEMAEARAKKLLMKTAPKLLPGSEVDATVPEAARAIGAHGDVAVRAIIDRDGRIIQAVVVQNSRSALLDAAALASVQQLKFEPAKDAGGNAIPVPATIPFEFYNIYAPGTGGGMLRYKCDQFVRDQDWWRANWPAGQYDRTYTVILGVGAIAARMDLDKIRGLNRDLPKQWDEAIGTCRKQPDAIFIDMIKPWGKMLRALAEQTK